MTDRDISARQLSPQERERYARHVILPSVGEEGQLRLKSSRVLVVGAGGLGSAAALYLAAAGVGCLGVADDDAVSVSNLQRQILHGTSMLDRLKTTSARRRLEDLNPEVEVRTHPVRIDTDSVMEIAGSYDILVDGTDNFGTRYVINAACLRLGIPYVYGAVCRLEGQTSVLCAKAGPCYQCMFPSPPPDEAIPTGQDAGILSTVPGIIGTIEATETIKWIVGLGEPLVGRLLVLNGASMTFTELHAAKNPDCPACGVTRKEANST